MKEIKIIRLTLENFKCHSHLNLMLEGRSTTIYGDNATGKTSIYDALTWLLFGKDSQGNGEKNIDIKPLDANGDVRDHQAITSVEAEFLADGETVVLQRTYREIWSTRRGSSEAVYDGNTSDYFVDGVPHKKSAFDARVRDLVSEDLFRMLTSVSYFSADMKWQDRRAVLFDMAGTMTDKEIMAGNAQFAPLLDSLGKLNLSEYKAKLLSQKKGLTGVRDDQAHTADLRWLPGMADGGRTGCAAGGCGGSADPRRREVGCQTGKRRHLWPQLVWLYVHPDTDGGP